MPGKLKIYSDRGSIKNIAAKQKEGLESEEPPTPEELHLKQLYEMAITHHDQDLTEKLGFVTIEYAGNKEALPISIHRLREVINTIAARPGSKVNEIRQELDI